MPLPLSYPGLKCVLENLEAVKRAHIIGRSPGLQKVDKLIPLCLKDFSIYSNQMEINNLRIYYGRDEVEFEMNGKAFSRKGFASRQDTIKKVFNFYFCERSTIHVDKVDWGESSLPDALALDIKFRVNILISSFRRQ
ncbi:hypothetical protein CRE_17430 [Caenorhabditis remanei]|nr:hypothetical protein CRE_17430 [Caenorhabditis remanei]